MERRCGETLYTRLSLGASSSYVLPEYSPGISSLKPVFQRGKYEEYILYTMRQGVVSSMTLEVAFTFPSV